MSVGKKYLYDADRNVSNWRDAKMLGVKMTDEEKMFPKMQSTEQLKTEVWNAAIEEVIKTLINKTYVTNEIKIIIRSLKK